MPAGTTDGSAEAHRWTWIDVRLVPVAAGLWAGSLLAPQLSWRALMVGAVTCGVLASLVARRRPVAALTPVALALLAGLAVSAVTGAVRGRGWEGSPLREAAAAGRTVSVQLEIDGEPRRLASGGAHPRIAVDVTVTRLVDGRQAHLLDTGAVLFGAAEDWQHLRPGQVVRVRAGSSLADQAGDASALLSARGPPEVAGGPSAVQRIAGGLREGFRNAAARVLPPRPAGLLPGLVVGDTSAMDLQVTEEFRRAGLTHLTAVSGANVAVVLTAVLWPLRRRAVDRRAQAAAAVVALVSFVVLVGPSPSVLRAAAMGGVVLLALASGRSRAAVPALGAAVSVLLLVQPSLAREAGFALSVAATAAIVLLAPGWSRRLRERGCWPLVADALAVSAAAGLATAPILAGLFGTVSLVSLPANLLAVPAVAPVTILGLPAVLLGGLLPWPADALVWLAGWPVRWLVLVAEWCAALPDGVATWPAGTVGAALLGAVLLLGGWALWRFPRLRPLAVAVLCGVVLLAWPVRQALPLWPPSGTVLVACDVGQGDALVLPTGPGAGVLVDAGPDPGAVDRCLDRLGIDALPLVLLTHLDADHVGGLAGALAGRRVGEVATGTLSPLEDRVGRVHAQIRQAGGAPSVLAAGDRRTVQAVSLEVLAPDPRRATAAAEANDLSLVVRATTAGVTILLAGDLGAEAEARLARDGTDLRAAVLKVPHHGSADFDAGFLTATGARVALVSVGAQNTYGHPAPSLLAALGRAGMRVHRTDQDGDLAVVGTAEEWGIAHDVPT